MDILDKLATLYPDKKIPYGGIATVARQTSLSRERVRQIAYANGYISSAREPNLCPVCKKNKLRAGTKTCRSCYLETQTTTVTLRCVTCNKTFERPLAIHQARVKTGRYRGRTYCSTNCYKNRGGA